MIIFYYTQTDNTTKYYAQKLKKLDVPLKPSVYSPAKEGLTNEYLKYGGLVVYDSNTERYYRNEGLDTFITNIENHGYRTLRNNQEDDDVDFDDNGQIGSLRDIEDEASSYMALPSVNSYNTGRGQINGSISGGDPVLHRMILAMKKDNFLEAIQRDNVLRNASREQLEQARQKILQRHRK
jgi:hypothetical protein